MYAKHYFFDFETPLEENGARRDPKAAQREPKGTKGSPKARQGIPNRANGTTKEGQKGLIASQRDPKEALAPKREFKGSLYTKTPDQPHQRPLCYEESCPSEEILPV